MPLELKAPIAGLRGAEYNPRLITEADFEALKDSVKALGIVKPVIARGDLLVAGHQRTKAMRALGMTHTPLYRLPTATTVYDEIRFNQLHNGTDLDSGDEDCRIKDGFAQTGYHVVDWRRILGNQRASFAPVRQELCNLIIKYGPWGGVVALKSGKVIHAAQYALSAAITRTPLTVCVLDDADEETAARYLGRTYGVFSYEHLDKKTYIQTFAQLSRLHEGETGKITHSTLYETMVIPYAAKRENRHNCYIDFGSGHGDYAAAMRGRGYAFDDVELFRRKGRARSGQVIDLAAVHAMIDRMVASFRQGRRYDATICDSVLNSVDCLKAEASVMTLLNAFTVPGGTVFFSGRPIEEPLASVARNSAGVFGTKMIRRVEFLDKDGFSALFRQGQWFYQKFHSAQQVRELAARFGFEILAHKHTGGSWQVTSRKVRELSSQEIAAAIDYEFNLAVGDRTRLGRHDDVKKALLPLVG